MEDPQETLVEEVHHDAVVRTELLVGALILFLLALAAVLWYLHAHPFGRNQAQEAATSTPAASAPALPSDAHLDETATYYDIKAAYPASTPLAASAGAQADAGAVASMKQFEETTIADFKKQGNFANLTHDDVQMMELDQRKESLEISYQSATGSGTVSYIYTVYEDTHGAHPNSFYRTFTFDAATGKELSLSDVFAAGSKYLQILAADVRKSVPPIIAARENIAVGDVDMDMLTAGTAPTSDNYQNWYLDGRNLVFIFPPYQVAPYAAGKISVSLPLSELTASLATPFR